MKKVSNFPQRYGSADTLGAANEITGGKVREAAALVRHGNRYPLGQVLEDGAPTQMSRYWKHSLGLGHVISDNYLGDNVMSFVEETVSGALHSGTHLDGLGHIGIGPLAYNGLKYADIVTSQGLTKLGIEEVPPFITRGVLLDIAALKGGVILDEAYAVTADDLEGACRRQAVEVHAGDAVIIHTGWGSLWMTDNERYAATEPGIELTAAAWCTDRHVCMIGTDNWAVEVVPFPEEDFVFPVHQHCITQYGVYLLENVRTAELASDGITEFCFMVSPVRFKGGSASPVTPVAIT